MIACAPPTRRSICDTQSLRNKGTSRTLVFRKAGVYRLTVTNVQTPEERGLTVLGETNTLTLTVVVK